MKLTYQQIVDLNPCSLDKIPEFGRRKTMSAKQAFAAGVSIINLCWVAQKLGRKDLLVRFALKCAQSVAHLNTDPRVQAALDATQAWIDAPTEENKRAAGAAAVAANAAATYAAANAAANAAAANAAAANATYAAGAAAVATYAAAATAANAAATYAAANAAANAAAADAAANATYAAAARYQEIEKQKQLFIEIFDGAD